MFIIFNQHFVITIVCKELFLFEFDITHVDLLLSPLPCFSSLESGQRTFDIAVLSCDLIIYYHF